jgi:hypothetical protein
MYVLSFNTLYIVKLLINKKTQNQLNKDITKYFNDLNKNTKAFNNYINKYKKTAGKSKKSKKSKIKE